MPRRVAILLVGAGCAVSLGSLAGAAESAGAGGSADPPGVSGEQAAVVESTTSTTRVVEPSVDVVEVVPGAAATEPPGRSDEPPSTAHPPEQSEVDAEGEGVPPVPQVLVREVAREVDLRDPVPAMSLSPSTGSEATVVAPSGSVLSGSVLSGSDSGVAEGKSAQTTAAAQSADVLVGEAVDEPPAVTTRRPPFVLLGVEVPPATSTRLSWSPSQSFEGIAVPTPVLVVNGQEPGPVLCLTAAVHGDELNGIEIVRRVLYNLDAGKLAGTVIGVPIVNLQGFRRGSRYLPDRRDLNRFFPGDPRGSSASRIAHSFFHEVISACESLVDLHTGSFYRTNLPQLRADLREPDVVQLTEGFDATVVLHSEGALGTLRKAAVLAGIPAVTLEAGEPMRLQEREVAHGVKSIQSLLSKMGMTRKPFFRGEPEPVYYESVWIRSERGGILFSEVNLGERVKKGNLLGTVTDPITNVRTEIRAPHVGRVLGMAVNQVVMPGFAAYRIGIRSSEGRAPGLRGLKADSSFHTSQLPAKEAPPKQQLLPDGSGDALVGLEDSE